MANCYAYTAPVFQPAKRIISAITNDFNASVTTTTDHDYIDGEIVRIYVPEGFGMEQINQQIGEITVTSSTTFTINIDTSKMDPFSIPADFPYSKQCAQVVPIGEINSTLAAATKNVLPNGTR
jgi:hypothetical protein